MTHPPRSLHGAPPLRPAPAAYPARVVELPPYDELMHAPAPPAMPTMTLSPRGTLYFTKAAMNALGLSSGSPANLVPPPFGSVYWHLDLRPTAPLSINWSGSLSVQRRCQSPRLRGIALPPGLVLSSLTLHLMPGAPHHPLYYPLLPANAFTAHP